MNRPPFSAVPRFSLVLFLAAQASCSDTAEQSAPVTQAVETTCAAEVVDAMLEALGGLEALREVEADGGN